MALATACADDNDFYDNGSYIYSKEPFEFGISETSLWFPYEGATQELILTSTHSWAATGVAEWVDLSALSGTGSADLTVTVAHNPGLETRVNVFNLGMTDYTEVNRAVEVSQYATSPYVEFVETSNLEVPATAGTYEIPFTTNLPLENISCSFSYTTPEMTAEVADGMVIVKTSNRTLATTTYNILNLVGTYEGRTYSRTRRIYQQGASGSPTISSKNCDAKVQKFDYSFEMSVDWTINTTASWLTVSPTAGDAGEHTVTVNVDANNSSQARTATVQVCASPSSAAFLSLSVTQAGIKASGSIDNFSNMAAAGETFEMDFYSDVPWKATSDNTAFEVVPASGNAGQTHVKIGATPNYSKSVRTGKVNFESNSGDRLWVVDITQQAAAMSFATNQLNFTGRNESKSVIIESNVPWRTYIYDDYSEWISVSPATGEPGTHELVVSVVKNETSKTRSGTLWLGYPGTNTVVELLDIVQSGASLTADAEINAGWEAAGIGFDITAPDAWTAAVSDASWMSLSQYSGSGPMQIAVMLTENTGDETRTGTLLIASAGRTETVKVTQLGQYLRIEGPETNLPSAGGSLTLEVGTSVGMEWDINYPSGDIGWLHCDELSSRSAAQTYIFKLSADANPNSYFREAVLTIEPGETYNGSTLSQGVKFVVRQEGRTLHIGSSAIFINGAGGTSDEISVDAEGPFSVKRADTDTWFTVITSATGFSIAATANTSGAKRTGTVYVTMDGLPAGQTMTVDIPVIQSDQNIGFDIEDYSPDKIWQ